MIGPDFLLQNKTAKKLYHDYAKDMPIFDYHCHLSPEEIAKEKRYANISEIWLYGDHYKWRAMRSMGISERYITNNSTSDYDRFCAFAGILPYLIGNPMLHWCQLELKRYFGIDKLLSDKTADHVWNRANEIVQGDDFSACSIIKQSNVKVICTTDDPTDDLKYHKQIAEDNICTANVLPTFRPDKAVKIDQPGFAQWVQKLAQVCNVQIRSLTDLLDCLTKRLEYFALVGCKVADHGLDRVHYRKASEKQVQDIFAKALEGKDLSQEEIEQYQTYLLAFFLKQYARLDFTAQLHMNVLRNNNSRMFAKLGTDTGFDSIGDMPIAAALSALLNEANKEDMLPRTILYSLNPTDNYAIGTMIGNFQGEGVRSKLQFGSGWWFNDQSDGMEDQMCALGNLGVLANFVGMLTDSRSFLSYTRHEYFRRVLCNLIGKWVEDGKYPNDQKMLGEIVQNICYNNAKEYFKIRDI